MYRFLFGLAFPRALPLAVMMCGSEVMTLKELARVRPLGVLTTVLRDIGHRSLQERQNPEQEKEGYQVQESLPALARQGKLPPRRT